MAVTALAVHGVMTGVFDREHRYRLNDFDLVVPGGQPVRWALNWLHRAGLADRVYGPDLMLKTCQQAAENSLPIFLFGGTRELLGALQASLIKHFPDLQIAGSEPSRFRRLTESERDEVSDRIKSSGAKITFVGLGCPRQEVWAYEFRQALGMPLLAVGAAFNFHAGLLAQAPPLLQRWGFEWLFRLLSEPRRLWKRYLFLNPAYLTLLLLQVARLATIDARCVVEPREEILYG